MILLNISADFITMAIVAEIQQWGESRSLAQI